MREIPPEISVRAQDKLYIRSGLLTAESGNLGVAGVGHVKHGIVT